MIWEDCLTRRGRRSRIAKLTEYDVFLPTRSNSGSVFAKSYFNKLKREIVEVFGGLTETSHSNKGFWKIGSLVVRDRLIVWRILSFKGQTGDKFMKHLKAKLEDNLAQDKILIIRRRVTEL